MKRALALVLSGASLLLTACGELPKPFPGINEDPVIVEMGDRFKVNVFFQNNENTHATKQSGKIKQFFDIWTDTVSKMMYSDISRTYIMDYDVSAERYGLVEYDRSNFANLTWENARQEYGIGGDHEKDENSFYIMDGKNGVTSISDKSRLEGGILRMFMDEVKSVDVMKYAHVANPENAEASADAAEEAEQTAPLAPDHESLFDPDAINIVFTDLSEKNITYLGEDLNTYYTADNRYNACVMAIKFGMNPGETIYCAGKDQSGALTPHEAGDSRWFYVLMMGPSTDLAVFVQKLTAKLNSENINEGVEGYELSDLSFTSENFVRDDDIVVNMLDRSNEEQVAAIQAGGADALFETETVRLERMQDRDSVFPVGIYRDNIMEYRYNASEKQFGLKGYQGASTKDFSLNIDLIKQVEQYDLVAESTELDYVFGEPVVYIEGKDGWEEMDPDHKERFFKRISVEDNDGKTLSIISDNADECDHHNVYITVPILQKATISQVVSDKDGSTTKWVLDPAKGKGCTVVESDPKEEVKRTYYFDKFYINVFGLKIEGDRDGQRNVYDETKDVFAQIDELKILIEGIH